MENKNIIELEKAIDTLCELCAGEIMRYSIQSFMEWFTKEERYKIAVWIAQKSYTKAHQEIMKYFLNNK